MSRDWTLYLEDIRDATVRNLEIIGEAAKRLPDEAKARMPEVDWAGSARFRDVVAHRYFGLDPAVVWSIVQTKIPALRSATERVLVETDGGKPGDSDAP